MEAVSSANVDVLLITGMRDEAPLAAFLYLVPDIRMIDVQVKASRKTQKTRGTYYPGTNASNHHGAYLTMNFLVPYMEVLVRARQLFLRAYSTIHIPNTSLNVLNTTRP